MIYQAEFTQQMLKYMAIFAKNNDIATIKLPKKNTDEVYHLYEKLFTTVNDNI